VARVPVVGVWLATWLADPECPVPVAAPARREEMTGKRVLNFANHDH
jgi:hypothetical protein